MKVLVTGAAGYVGSVLVPLLLERGHAVVALDNLMHGGPPPRIDDPGSRFVLADVRDEAAMRAACRDVDAAVHLAAIVGYPACRRDPALATAVNVEGTRTLARSLGRQQPLVFASTGSNYGRVEGTCTEETPLAPLSHYGETKTAGEAICAERGATILRFATAFGVAPRMRLDLLVNDFVHRALTEHELIVYEAGFRRSFLHVTDVARGCLLALELGAEVGGRVLNVGHESMNVTKRHIALTVRRHVPCRVEFAEIGRDEDQRDHDISYERVRAAGFAPSRDLESGIAELVAALAPRTAAHAPP